MIRWCSDWDGRPARRAKDGDQVIDIRLLQAFLQVAGDPEAPALDCYATGIRLGHNMRMPRTPAVFKAKKNGGWNTSYRSTTQKNGSTTTRLQRTIWLRSGRRSLKASGCAGRL